LKLKCLKWVRRTHLSIQNISYGQKKGRESNCQFKAGPLKVENHLEIHACRWSDTYHWKSFDEGHNFASYLTSIKGFHKKLWPFKVPRVPNLRNWDSQLGSLWKKWHSDVGPVANHKEYYEGEGDNFPQVWVVVNLVIIHVCSWFIRAPKVLQLHINQFDVGLCTSVWIIDPLVTRPHPHLEVLACPSNPEMLQVRQRTPTFSSLLFYLWTHYCVDQGVWGASHGIKAPVKLDPPIWEFWWHRRRLVNQYKRPWFPKCLMIFTRDLHQTTYRKENNISCILL
jgi:hypothetical protein